MNAQEQADAKSRGYSVLLQERGAGNWSYWVYFNGNQMGGPFGSESEGWNRVEGLINQQSYGM
ncbi:MULTISPECIES: hypothetical protein [unclassified Pseudomonas]|uniref:hypothetical protein n=1 Tax=unclassified Pseudomonas TaxID=196821 RepID=UPI000A1FCD85|nr:MULTISPECIES: hypothetical protein [unclassified Pseudomonas]MDI2142088.1 hypothetical protein [Pseudomonas sp. ITA]